MICLLAQSQLLVESNRFLRSIPALMQVGQFSCIEFALGVAICCDQKQHRVSTFDRDPGTFQSHHATLDDDTHLAFKMCPQKLVSVACLTTEAQPCTISVDANRLQQRASHLARQSHLDGDRCRLISIEERRHATVGTASDDLPAVFDPL